MGIIQNIFYINIIILSLVYSGYYLLCIYLGHTKKLKVKKSRKFKPEISIIIPAWNEEKTIKGKLENTLKLKYPRKLEIIVVDDGSDDKTSQIVKKFKNVKLLVQKKRQGKAIAMNRAFKYCKGDLVLITDADSRLKENSLIKSVPYFFDESVGAVTGQQSIPNKSETITTKIETKYRDFFYILREAESIIDSTFIFDGPFMMVRKKLLENINRDSVADDSELALRVRKKGYRTLSLKEVKYIEYSPRKITDRTKRKKRRAQGLIQIMIRFFPVFFLNSKYKFFGIFIFPVEFFMHLISPMLILLSMITFWFLPLEMMVVLLVGAIIGLAIPKTRSILFAFLHSQYACFRGLISYLLKKSHKWEQITDTRRYD
jgi:cellulose synthase/poly-beta-1,6-N-acetylglucosamine synthase-like glycosyltransferase